MKVLYKCPQRVDFSLWRHGRKRTGSVQAGGRMAVAIDVS